MSEERPRQAPGARTASAADAELTSRRRDCGWVFDDCLCDSCALALVRGRAGRAGPPLAAPVRSPVILEEKPICRAAMADLLRELGETGPPAFASSLSEALEASGSAGASITLIDLFSIHFDFEGLRRLVNATGAPVIAIDDRPNPTFARLAQQAGARGYACKAYELDQFTAVVRAVMDGGAHFPPEAQAKASPAAGRRSAGLSQRQLEVLKCIAIGMSNQEIARALGITVGTVKLHIHAILRATGTRNRTEVALIAGRFLAPIVEP